MKFRILAASAVAVGALALASPVQAAEGDVDVSAWLQANKDTVEVFLGVDVDTCKGVDGLTYDESLRLADAEGIDLKELAKHTDPEAIMEYVNDAGITLGDIDRFLNRFCAGEVPIPAPSATQDGPDGSESPSSDPSTSPDASEGSSESPAASEGSSEAPAGSDESPAASSEAPAGSDESPAASEGAKDDAKGSMAHTGASPLLPLGVGTTAVGLGAAAVWFARSRGII
jgi:hypothetical protein